MTREILTAEIIAVGTELTTGSTRDANGGDLARELTALGVKVRRISQLPDDLRLVTAAFSAAFETAHLVVSTGGLGPTPDDLTREAIAVACGLEPYVDDELEGWLRQLFARRGTEMPSANRKQAWLVEGATHLPNNHGTAPGWWLERTDGGLLLALPGPPAEMWPMWSEHARPRLIERGIGAERVVRTLRLTGIGESVLVGLIGDPMLRATSPQVATYARPDSVDVRISAVAGPEAGDDTPQALVERAYTELMGKVGEYVFAEDDDGWPEALGKLLGSRRMATVEIGTAGQLAAILGRGEFYQYGQLLRSSAAAEHAEEHLGLYAERVRETSGADVGLAVHAREQGNDMRVVVAINTNDGTTLVQRPAFLTGEQGRRRAALVACGVLWQQLRTERVADHAGSTAQTH